MADERACYVVPAFTGNKYEPRLLEVRSTLVVDFTDDQFRTALPHIERTIQYGHVSVRLIFSPHISVYELLDLIRSQSPTVFEHLCSNLSKEDITVMDRLMNETLTLKKQSGREVQGIRASVQRGKIFISDGTLPLEEGDILVRELPNGMTESYVIEDRGYYAAIGGIHAHYQAKVRRESTPSSSYGHTVWNVSGQNARVNIHSQDNSSNTVAVTPANVLAELARAVSSQVSGEARDELLAKLDEMKRAVDTKSKLQKYQEFIALAANITTIAGPFLTALAAWLSK
jgi:hypothetical protein